MTKPLITAKQVDKALAQDPEDFNPFRLLDWCAATIAHYEECNLDGHDCCTVEVPE